MVDVVNQLLLRLPLRLTRAYWTARFKSRLLMLRWIVVVILILSPRWIKWSAARPASLWVTQSPATMRSPERSGLHLHISTDAGDWVRWLRRRTNGSATAAAVEDGVIADA